VSEGKIQLYTAASRKGRQLESKPGTSYDGLDNLKPRKLEISSKAVKQSKHIKESIIPLWKGVDPRTILEKRMRIRLGWEG